MACQLDGVLTRKYWDCTAIAGEIAECLCIDPEYISIGAANANLPAFHWEYVYCRTI